MSKFNFLFAFIFFAGCTKERPQMQVPSPILPKIYSKAFVINEGFFGQDNSSISLYDETQGLVSDNYFKHKNPNSILGSVPQSMCKIANNYYLVVNYAGKIIVLDSAFVKITEITNLLSPRYMLVLPNNKAYVSDLHSKTLHIINTFTNQKIGNIGFRGWSEKLVLLQEIAYVTNYDTEYLYAINTNSDEIQDSIRIGLHGIDVVKDNKDNLWVLCSIPNNSDKKFLYCINPTTKKFLKTFEFPVKDVPSKLCINKTGDNLYYINKHVYKLSINDTSLPSSFLIDGSAPKIFYGLGINPSNENIYLSNYQNLDLNLVYIHKNTGEYISEFNAGKFAGNFFFDK